MPRFYGKPSVKAAKLLQTREDFTLALRNNDQKMLLGLGSSDEETDSMVGGYGYMNVVPGIQTNRFVGFGDYLQAGTSKVWAAARAVDVTGNVVLSTEMKMVWRDPAKNKKKIKPRVDPDLARILLNPNPYDTISEMLYLLVAHLKVTGNAFWFKDEMNAFGQPKNVFWLNPRFIRIVPDKDLRVAKYLYRVNNTEIEFTPDEIIHFRRPHANDPLWGLGDIEQAESLYDDFINRALYNVRYMANGAFPSSVLVNEDFEGEQTEWDRKKSAFNESYSGVKNSGKVAWLNGKWSLLQMGVTAQSMQELEKSKVNVEHIFINQGVPLSVAGFGASNYATARQDDINFRKYTVLPILNLITDALNSDRGFIKAFSDDIKLDFSLAGLVDVEQVMKDYAPLFDRGGVSPNELRVLCGQEEDPDPFMKQRFILSTYVPIEMAGVAMEQPALPAGQSHDGTTTGAADGAVPKNPVKPGKPKPEAGSSGGGNGDNAGNDDAAAA